MIHQYKLNGYNIVLDVYSGSIHLTDEAAYDAIRYMDEGKTREEAEKLLTVWNPGNGHVGLGAVKSLLAKVHLTMAGYPLRKTDHYAQALAKAKEVAASGAFTLYKDVHDIANSAKRNKEEAIFTAQYNKSNGNSPMHGFFLPYYAGWDKEAISESQSFGGAIVPSQAFINTYETGDKRAMEKGWYYNSYKKMDGSGNA
jgi:hypothetical protein